MIPGTLTDIKTGFSLGLWWSTGAALMEYWMLKGASGAQCPGQAQIKSLSKKAPAQSIFSLRGVQGGTSRTHGSSEKAHKRLLWAGSHLMVYEKWDVAVKKGLWAGTDTKGCAHLSASCIFSSKVHLEESRGVCIVTWDGCKTFKSTQPTLDFPPYKFWIQAKQIFTFILRTTAMTCPLLRPSFFVCLLKHTGEVYFRQLKQEEGSCGISVKEEFLFKQIFSSNTFSKWLMDKEENEDVCTKNQLCERCRAASKTHAYVSSRGSEAGVSTPQIWGAVGSQHYHKSTDNSSDKVERIEFSLGSLKKFKFSVK